MFILLFDVVLIDTNFSDFFKIPNIINYYSI